MQKRVTNLFKKGMIEAVFFLEDKRLPKQLYICFDYLDKLQLKD